MKPYADNSSVEESTELVPFPLPADLQIMNLAIPAEKQREIVAVGVPSWNVQPEPSPQAVQDEPTRRDSSGGRREVPASP